MFRFLRVLVLSVVALVVAVGPGASLVQAQPSMPTFVADTDVDGHVDLVKAELAAPLKAGLLITVGCLAVFLGYRLFRRFAARG